jgi:CRP/FNR family cyclic AMP-dependent transcriptional regulator
MSEIPTVFLGSSSEAQDNAKILQDVLFDCGAEVTAWWSDSAFPASKTFIECLFDLARSTDASLLIASEDDRITKRGQSEFAPRDNVIFEHGLFAGSHGRARAAIATIGKQEWRQNALIG